MTGLRLILTAIILTFHLVDSFRLYILHTNDIHARLNMFNKNELVCNPRNASSLPPTDDKMCYGGVVRRAGFVNEFRRNHENVLLLDAGDQFVGSPWFFTYKGVEASHFLNLLRYDAMALGNHEFDNGVDGLIPFLKNITVPILCANLIMNDEVPQAIKQSVKSHVIVERGGKKIGIIGYITHTVTSLAPTGKLSFREETEVIKELSQQLKQDGVDIVLAVGHSGMEKDKEMAPKLPDVDIIVGGHSHSLFYTGKNPYNDEVVAEYPIVFKHQDTGSTTLVVQAYTLGKYVGMLNSTFDLHGKLVDWSGNPVVIDENVPEDSEIKMEMEYLEKNVSSTFKAVIGHIKVTLDASDNKCRIRECNIGNLYTDGMVRAVQNISRWSKLSIGVATGGSFRSSLSAGDVTYADVITVLPFGSNLVIVVVNGSVLIEMFEHSVAGYDLKNRRGRYLQVSGLQLTYNMSRSDGNRVELIEVEKCYKCKQYEKLVESQEYPIIISEYILKGGDGYSMLEGYAHEAFPIGLVDSMCLLEQIQREPPETIGVEGRINGMETFPGWHEGAGVNKASLIFMEYTMMMIMMMLISKAFVEISPTFIYAFVTD